MYAVESSNVDKITTSVKAVSSTASSTHRVIKELGRGSSSVVYLAQNRETKEEVALKILSKDKGAVFTNEIEINNEISHKHIVPVLETGESERTFYIAMKPIYGFDLHDIIQERSQKQDTILSEDELFQVLFPIMDALDYIHEKKIIHCDIKPANILCSERFEKVFLADFGIAQNTTNKVPQNASVVKGSPLFIAPEQIGGGAIDNRVDIYSLGLTIVKLLTGTLPCREEQSAEVVKRKYFEPETFIIKNLHEYPQISRGLAAILEKAIAPYPEDRFDSIRQMRSALSAYRKTIRPIPFWKRFLLNALNT